MSSSRNVRSHVSMDDVFQAWLIAREGSGAVWRRGRGSRTVANIATFIKGSNFETLLPQPSAERRSRFVET